MSKDSITPLPDSDLIPISTNELIKSLSIQMIEPIMREITNLVVDISMLLYNQRLSKDSFLSYEVAEQLFGINIDTINKLVNHNLLNKYTIKNKPLLSLFELRAIIQAIFNTPGASIKAITDSMNAINESNSGT